METLLSLVRLLHDQGCNANDISVLADITTNQLSAAKKQLKVVPTIEFVSDTQLDVTIDLFDSDGYLYHEFSIIVRR